MEPTAVLTSREAMPSHLSSGASREQNLPRLPGSCHVKVLSRSPFEASVATLGYIHREFEVERIKYSAYVGLSQSPLSGRAYVRFATVVGRPPEDLRHLVVAEGATMWEDPFDHSLTPRHPRYSVFDRYIKEREMPIFASCYRACVGIIKMIRDLEILHGKGFRPIRDLGKVFSLTWSKIILARILRDPETGLENFLAEISNYIQLDRPSKDGLTISHLPDGMVSLILSNEFYGFDRSEPLPLLVRNGLTVALQQFQPSHDYGGSQGVQGHLQPGLNGNPAITLHTAELDLLPNPKWKKKIASYPSDTRLLVMGRQSATCQYVKWNEKWVIHIPFFLDSHDSGGLYLRHQAVESEILVLFEELGEDPPWIQGGTSLDDAQE